MWNDEDNNPYGSFGQPIGGDDSPPAYDSPSPPAASSPDPSSPTSPPSPDLLRSRVDRILAASPGTPILITHAGKNPDAGGFIVYTIRTGELEVRRRYSEFASLRQSLVALHPTVVVPPIPEKHSVADYAARPTRAKDDTTIIDLRKRMLAVFLNRCRRIPAIRDDDVWSRFLDPNVSWNEVLHTPPLASIPKNILRAPPLDPSSPSPAHAWLPLPPTSARLRDDPDPDFAPAEATARELELLLAGPVDKINRRTLAHLSALSADLMDLGARYNAFSLNEPSRSVAAAIERVGQAADTSYIESDDLAQALTAAFVEPMRETAQFAAVVRTVLRYRALKCLQENMTRDQLAAKHSLLAELEASELEARRIDSYLSATGRHPINTLDDHDHRHPDDDATSVDSDFPPARDDRARPSAAQGAAAHRKSASTSTASTSSYLPNRLFDRLSHAVHGFVDADPERSRRDQIGKTKESLVNLDQALQAAQTDTRAASTAVLADLRRFSRDNDADLRRYMVSYARCHLDWARRNLDTWAEAHDEVDKIET